MLLSNKILFFGIAFLVGVALASFLRIEFFLIFILFLTAVVMAVFLNFILKINQSKSSFRITWYILLLLLGIICGIWRFNLSLPSASSVAFLPPQKIIFQGELTDPPIRKINKQSFWLNKISFNHQIYQDKILIITNLFPTFPINQRLQVECNLKKPGKIENFNYGEYLANQKIYKVCYYPKINILGPLTGFSFNQKVKNFFISLKTKLNHQIQTSLPLPHSAILSAILLGQRSEIDLTTRSFFSQTGVAHIIAISGMHISILSLIIFNFLLCWGVGRDKSFKIITSLLIFYLLLIGFKASAIRAVIMGLILSLAEKEGRLNESGRAIVFAAVILLLLNPRLLRWDAGFQLSFAATLGIVNFSPYFIFLFKKIPHLPTRKILAMTLSSQFTSWPLVVYHFGIISLSGLITNLLIVPSLALLLQMGLFFLVFSFWFPPPLIYWLALPLWLMLTYILKITEFFSHLPLSYFEFQHINFIWLPLFYALIVLGYFYLQKHYATKT